MAPPQNRIPPSQWQRTGPQVEHYYRDRGAQIRKVIGHGVLVLIGLVILLGVMRAYAPSSSSCARDQNLPGCSAPDQP